MRRPTLLLHICCAPCSTHVISLLAVRFDLAGLFHNPNIHPGAEYALRRGEAARFCRGRGIPLLCTAYRPGDWFSTVRGREGDPEGGVRCALCIRMRLDETARAAALGGFDCFGTTLTVSPHKDAGLINVIGAEAARRHGVRFLAADFKKGDGYAASCRMSRLHGLYRQRYCGCIYSAMGGGGARGASAVLFLQETAHVAHRVEDVRRDVDPRPRQAGEGEAVARTGVDLDDPLP